MICHITVDLIGQKLYMEDFLSFSFLIRDCNNWRDNFRHVLQWLPDPDLKIKEKIGRKCGPEGMILSGCMSARATEHTIIGSKLAFSWPLFSVRIASRGSRCAWINREPFGRVDFIFHDVPLVSLEPRFRLNLCTTEPLYWPNIYFISQASTLLTCLKFIDLKLNWVHKWIFWTARGSWGSGEDPRAVKNMHKCTQDNWRSIQSHLLSM
jgi:hypothetical protein